MAGEDDSEVTTYTQEEVDELIAQNTSSVTTSVTKSVKESIRSALNSKQITLQKEAAKAKRDYATARAGMGIRSIVEQAIRENGVRYQVDLMKELLAMSVLKV